MFTYSLGRRALKVAMPWMSAATNSTVATCRVVCVPRAIQPLGAPAPSKWLATFSGSRPCCQSARPMVARTRAKKAICSRDFIGGLARRDGALHALQRLEQDRAGATEVETDELPCRRAVLGAIGEADAVFLKEVTGVVQLQGGHIQPREVGCFARRHRDGRNLLPEERSDEV